MKDFLFKPFEEMTDEDYATVGFKSGLEIHQQLLTEKKLFCRCPAGLFNKKYDAEILRHMRPTLSELGEYDGTALMEFKTKKNIIYQINRESVCTYEMDDTPPFLMNDEALDIALECGLLFDCNIVDELHIARKQYLDGSIPTGFQRTAIFALDGKIPFKGREVSIIQMSIEEDSCREVSDIGHDRVYITDRLGMPLIETVTGPDMKTPCEVAEVAELCAKVVRSTNKVRRGAGAAREDVNVSVEGGTRIEIKGVPKISRIPLLTYNEAMRQWNLLRLKEELKNRGITEKTFEATTSDVTKLLKKPHYLPIKSAIEKGKCVKCVVLKGFEGLLHWQTQTDTYFSKEISDRVRVISCLTTIPNIIHSDAKGDSLTSSEWLDIKKSTNAADNDTIVIVWGSEIDSTSAANEIIIRAKEATMGIPSETRQALRDGTNGFERILPGADRMYPDTDLPPQRVTKERQEILKKNINDKVWEREEWYKKLGIPVDTIEPLIISEFSSLFKTAVKKMKLDPTLAAEALIQWPKKLNKLGYDPRKLSAENLKIIFEFYRDKKISRYGIFLLMVEICKGEELQIDINGKHENINRLIVESKNEVEEMKLRDQKNFTKLLMSQVMKDIRLYTDGAEIKTKVEEYLSEVKNG